MTSSYPELSTIEAARVSAFAVATIEMCRAHGASVTSWQRSPAHNARVGGRPDSFHLEGLAVDLVLEDQTRMQALLADARSAGLEAVVEDDHVHVELDYHRAR